jgi:hypothetical protein
MNAGERVDLIRKIADSLTAGDEFSRVDVDLIFNQLASRAFLLKESLAAT